MTDRLKHSLTTEDVRALYEVELMKHDRDKRRHGPLSLDDAMLRATRTMVHIKLQEQLPPPPAITGEDPDETHARQKAHNKRLWQETNLLVAEANLGGAP